MDKIDVVLNGVEVSGHEGMTILELAKENGIDIPTLCYMSELTPTGACRLCVVEVENARTLVASCLTPIGPNMNIQTHSPKALKARKIIVELLLANHPDNCMLCDKANFCELHKVAMDLDIGLPRYRGEKRYYPIEEVSPYLTRDLTKCILCRKCVRACDEIKREALLGMGYRGFCSKIIVDADEEIDKDVCKDCYICVDACPTGALMKREESSLPRKRTPLVITGS